MDGTAATAQGISASPNSGNLTTTASGDLLLRAILTRNPTSFTAGSGYTVEEAVPAKPNTKLIADDQIQLAAGTASASALLGASDSWAAALAAFKAAGGTGGIASSITANAGTTPQSTTISTAFANALAVTVKDAGSNPVSGVNVTFTAPGAGASGVFSNSTATIIVATNGSEEPRAGLTGNARGGAADTDTTAAAGLTPVNFSLTNTVGAATTMTANAGTTPQSATISTAVSNALAVTVKDAGSNPVSGVNVTFTAPGAGASGVFSNSTATIIVATNGSEEPRAGLTGNARGGAADTDTTAAAGLTPVNFSLTNTVGAATTMTANAGTTPQSATISTAVSNALAVTVKDAGSNPVSGVNVTFAAPGSGASGVFSNSTATIIVATNALGVASAPFRSEERRVGKESRTGGSPDQKQENYRQTNTVVLETTMTMSADLVTGVQTCAIAIANALAVTVKDAGSNPVSGVNVTFAAPGSGASGVFSNSTATIIVATNALGVASAPFTANTTAGGPYTVTAAATGLTPVNFSLTNTAVPPSTMTANAGTTPQSAAISTAFANALAVTVKDAGSDRKSVV